MTNYFDADANRKICAFYQHTHMHSCMITRTSSKNLRELSRKNAQNQDKKLFREILISKNSMDRQFKKKTIKLFLK